MSAFIIDAQLPPALAHLLREEGHEAVHVTDVMFQDTVDSEIWTYAMEHEMTVVTKDEDLPQRQMQSKSSPVIVWVRIGNTSKKALLAWFKPLLPAIEEQLSQGNKLIEIR